MLRQAGHVRLPETAEDLQDPDFFPARSVAFGSAAAPAAPVPVSPSKAPAVTATAKVRFIS
jgi:hypothetical protein